MEAVLWLALGILLLVFGGEYLVKASVAVSQRLHISRIVIGMTVVSFATSVPELIVSLLSAVKGHPDIALGNVVGSNVANIALVLGFTAILIPIGVKRPTYAYNWPMMMLMSALLWLFLFTGHRLSGLEGLILFVALVVFVVFIVRQSYRSGDAALDEPDEDLHGIKFPLILFWLVLSGAALYLGSRWLVDGAVELARMLGVSERIISISVIAVGTSVPELAASVISALKKERDLSLGNLVGSNIFNIGSVLGLTAIIKPIARFDAGILQNDIYWMTAISLLVVPLALLPPRNRIDWWKGSLFLLLYALFIYYSYAL